MRFLPPALPLKTPVSRSRSSDCDLTARRQDLFAQLNLATVPRVVRCWVPAIELAPQSNPVHRGLHRPDGEQLNTGDSHPARIS